MAVRMRVDMSVVVIVAVGVRRNHSVVLYYNITRVYRWNPHLSAALGLADCHGDGGGQKRERNGNCGSKPHETSRHERDFPE
jgi:hypothetical protein